MYHTGQSVNKTLGERGRNCQAIHIYSTRHFIYLPYRKQTTYKYLFLDDNN